MGLSFHCSQQQGKRASVAESYTKVIVSHHLDILYLGRIEPNKGMDFLYDALEQWKEEYDDFTLHFAGIEHLAFAAVLF